MTSTSNPGLPVNLLGVVGAGVMGAGIAEAAARTGCTVVVTDAIPAAREAAALRIGGSLARAEKRGSLSEPAADILARITWSDDVTGLADCPIVIEAIRESLDDKIALFRSLDDVVGPDAILATNTSSIPVARIASNTRHPERVVGLHFFNPVPAMPLVEVVSSLLTSDEAADSADAFVREALKKDTIRAKDRAGFVVNAILVPYLLSAIRSLENGVASADDIDRGMVGGCGMPMGPLRLMDMIGLDTMLLVADSLYEEYRDAANLAPSLLRRHVDAGWLGRKSGRGFYDYSGS